MRERQTLPQIIFHESILSRRILVNPQVSAEVLKAAGMPKDYVNNVKILLADRSTKENLLGAFDRRDKTMGLFIGSIAEWKKGGTLSDKVNYVFKHEAKHAAESLANIFEGTLWLFLWELITDKTPISPYKMGEKKAEKFADEFKIDHGQIPIAV